MARPRRYTREQVEQALQECRGLLFLAAEKLGCQSKTVIAYMHRYPVLYQIVQELRGRRVDLGEAVLDKAVMAGEPWAVMFLLRTQGKDRGYVDRVEVIRTRPDFTRQLLTSDLRKLWQGDYSQNLLLEPGDHITIGSESRPLGAVTLQGEVKRPGTYPIIQGELRQLSDRQKVLQEMLHKIATQANQ